MTPAHTAPDISTPILPSPNDPMELNALITRELKNPRRGTLSQDFRTLISPYLVTDPTSDQFLHIHRAAAPLQARSKMLTTISVDHFREFLTLEGPQLEESYVNFKCRGHTGCVVVAHEATVRLNRTIPGCAETKASGDGSHYYTRVSIEGRDYWLDFTIDQFVAYPEIVERHRMYATMRLTTPRPSYAGTLIMPIREN